MPKLKGINMPDRDTLIQFYITECHSREEVAEHFGVALSTACGWLQKLKIKKTREEKLRTSLRVYGAASPQQTPEAQNKRFATCTERFGSISPFGNAEVYQKGVDRIMERYGVANILYSDEIKQKRAAKFGGPSPFSDPATVQKAHSMIEERYGASNYLQSDHYRERVRQELGVDWPNQSHISHAEVWLSGDLMRTFLVDAPDAYTVFDLAQYFNVDITAVYKKLKEYGLEDLVSLHPSRSRYEDEIVQYLKTLGVVDIQLNARILNRQEVDIYLPEHRIGIEFNGDYWHSDVYKTDHNGRSTYHQDKSLLAADNDIFLFHIFEYEWNDPGVQEQIKNRLRALLVAPKYRVMARKCSVVRLSKNQKKAFLCANHIQGNDRATYAYGLMCDNELVACMTFVKSKNAKYTWELSRFCSKHDYRVVGGASKLFKHFLQQLQIGDTVVSYNDITKTRGDLYPTLGFHFVSINSPNYVWINSHTGDIRTRYQEQAAGEVDRMHAAGYHRVCDCGTKTWVFTKQ